MLMQSTSIIRSHGTKCGMCVVASPSSTLLTSPFIWKAQARTTVTITKHASITKCASSRPSSRNRKNTQQQCCIMWARNVLVGGIRRNCFECCLLVEEYMRNDIWTNTTMNTVFMLSLRYDARNWCFDGDGVITRLKCALWSLPWRRAGLLPARLPQW